MSFPRVLLLADESPGSLAAVRGLRASGYEPWVAVSRDDTYAARSSSAAGVVRLPVEHVDSDTYAEDLASRIDARTFSAILPATEASLIALSGRDALFPGTSVGTCAATVIDRATDKLHLGELAARYGLETPPTVPLSPQSVNDERLTFPLLAKPLHSVGTAADGRDLRRRRVVIAERREQLERLLAESPADVRWIAQPLIEGALSAISGVAWQGQLLSAFCQRSLCIWPPRTGMTACAISTPLDRELHHGVAGIVADLGWSGIYNLQALRTENGPVVIDFNPRVYGSMALALASGHNLAGAWADLLLGKRPEFPPYRVGVTVCVEERFSRALLDKIGAGRLREAVRLARWQRHSQNAVLSREDLRPVLALAVRARRKLASARPSGR